MQTTATTYRLNSMLISKYVNRQTKRIAYTMALAFVPVLLITAANIYMYNSSTALLAVYVVSAMVPLGIMAFFFYHSKTFHTYIAENLRIITDQHTITRVVDLTQETRMNFLHRYMYNMHGSHSGYYCTMLYGQIQDVQHKSNNDIHLKSTTASILTGTGIMVIPCELENLQQLVEEINLKR